MRTKRAGFLTKLVVLALLVATATALLGMHGRIQTARADRDELAARMAAQTQVNAELADAVEHSDDPERQADIARDRLGLVAPGEQVIYFTD